MKYIFFGMAMVITFGMTASMVQVKPQTSELAISTLNKQLWKAIKKRNLEQAKKLLAADTLPAINYIYTENLKTPLMVATRYYDINKVGYVATLVNILISAGVCLESTDEKGRTALAWAIKVYNFGAITALITAGAALTEEDKRVFYSVPYKFYNIVLGVIQEAQETRKEIVKKQKAIETNEKKRLAAQYGDAHLYELVDSVSVDSVQKSLDKKSCCIIQ